MPSDRLAKLVIFLWRVLFSKYRQTGSAAARDDNILRTVSCIICIIYNYIIYLQSRFGQNTFFCFYPHLFCDGQKFKRTRCVRLNTHYYNIIFIYYYNACTVGSIYYAFGIISIYKTLKYVYTIHKY